MAEKEFQLTIYSYCGNNPISYTDSDGRIRTLHINQKKRTITVSANFEYNRYQSADAQAIGEAARLINSQNGSVKYEGKEYKVVFKLSTSDHREENTISENNTITIVKDNFLGFDKNGNKIAARTDSKSNEIYVEYQHRKNIRAIAHEMLHALGAALPENGEDRHSKEGLMTKSLSAQSDKLLQENIDDIVFKGNGKQISKQ